MKDHYRIAFFTVDWNYELVEGTLHGLKQYVDEHENIQLCVFDCFGKDLDNAKDKSEYQIFRLPDLTQFDGIIVLGNQIILQRARDELAERIVQAGVPAVSIGCPLPGCTLIGHDNRSAQRDITSHVIREHGARRLVYLTGIISNECPEAEQRLDGFMDACRENNLSDSDIQVLSKTWRTTDGIETARRWVESGSPLPDAFICANDEMALGLMATLVERGVKVPEDVIVTGYDNLTSAELSCPRLASVFCDYHRLLYRAMDILMDKLLGREVSPFVSSDYRVVPSESCGCRETERPTLIRDKYFRQTRFLRSFYLLQDQMAEEMFEANNLQDLTEAVLRNRAIFGCNDIFLCFNDYYFDNYEKSEWAENSETYGQEMVLAKRLYQRFPTRDLLPEPYFSEERFLIFYPLHYNTYSIGYIALDGISEAAKMNLHESILNFLEIAIENIRKKELLRHFNELLDDLYVHDGLTGLFNRFGFERFAPDHYDRFLAEKGAVQVLFMDLDDMKVINDTYGHEFGDLALKTVARILKENCAESDFIMRYGGDEFVVVADGRWKDLKDRILSAVDRASQSSGFPFTLGLSIGAIFTRRGEKRSLEDCMREADALMYQIKTARKVGR